MKQFLLALLAFSLAGFSNENPAPTAKDIEKVFAPLGENKFLGKYEVSNKEYRQFLTHLEITGQPKLYNQYLQDTSLWKQEELEGIKNYYHAHATYDNYPVVTITYEAATAYCNWLTEQYNSDKKRTYKTVKFRLPTEEEWQYAANGGNKNKMYPWGNFYLRNRKGEFLCNFRHIGDQAITYDTIKNAYVVLPNMTGDHRAILFAEVTSFAPTGNGFHNLSGNAAEMVAEKGLAKGGSYNDPGYDVTISRKKYFAGAAMDIGFRVLMEIVEK